jgi:hypothetical protein
MNCFDKDIGLRTPEETFERRLIKIPFIDAFGFDVQRHLVDYTEEA